MGLTMETAGWKLWRPHRPDEFKVRDSVRWRHLFIAIARHNSKEDARREAESLAAELQEISHNARGQEPDGRPPVSPAGSSPAPLSLPPPPATLGKPTTDSPKPAGGESSGVAKLKAPEGLTIGRPLSGGVVVAMVNGQAILEEEVRVAMVQGGLGEGQPMAEQRRLALETLIDRELVVQDCTMRLSRNPQAQKFLDKLKELAGKEFDRYLKQIKTRNRIESDEEFEKVLEAQGMPLELMRRQQERNFPPRRVQSA